MKRLLWAIDPAHTAKAPPVQAIPVLEALARGSRAAILPVAVVRAPLESSREALQSWLDTLSLPSLTTAKILRSEDPTPSGVARVLLDYARRAETSLLVVNKTHRRAVPGWFVGSFAETLGRISDVPVLVLKPKSATESPDVLFPTDFSDDSRAALELLADSLGSGWHVQLFHRRETRTPERVRATAALWKRALETRGISSAVHVTFASSSVERAVLEYAEAHPPFFIAIASRSARRERTFLGSVSLQILRQSRWPVWTLHPRLTQAALRDRICF